MATKPTPGGSDGTYGTELNAFLDVSLAADGKVKTEALQTDSTAPSADAALTNKKYIDDQIVNASPTAKAWCQFTSSGDLHTGSLNITSVVKDSTGVYTVTFTSAFSNTKYAVIATPISIDTTGVRTMQVNTLATGSFKVSIESSIPSPIDTECSIVVFGG